MSSSTSSFRRARVPWGALWAIGFFAAAEVVFRLLPVSWFLTLDQHDYGDVQTLDYSATELAIELLPPADVVVMGTSRAREAVVSPELAAALREKLGRPVTVRNYGVAAGRIDVTLALLRRMARERKLPRVVVVAIDASDFRDLEPSPDRFRFVTLGMLPGEIARTGWPSERDGTQIIGNSIPLRMRLARPTLHYRLVRWGRTAGFDAPALNAAFGGSSGWARDYDEAAERGDVLATKTQDLARIARGYGLRPDRLAVLEQISHLARASSIRLIYAELPVFPQLRTRGVRQLERRLRAALEAMRGDAGVVADPTTLASFTAEDFFDVSHINARGARRFTELLVGPIEEALLLDAHSADQVARPPAHERDPDLVEALAADFLGHLEPMIDGTREAARGGDLDPRLLSPSSQKDQQVGVVAIDHELDGSRM